VRILRPVAAGTVLSSAALGGAEWWLDPGPADLPVSFRHPWAALLALIAAPTGNGWKLLGFVALVMFACLLVSGWREHRRCAPEDPED
jgi:hypothetical protein